MSAFETIMVERPDPRVARIVMNRPEARNAQNLQMTYDLNAAIDQAFGLHQLCHAHNLQEFGMIVDPAGLHPSVKKTAVVK
jgi:1,4-dihydroxy-2-naphthoyl-CoA synthase